MLSNKIIFIGINIFVFGLLIFIFTLPLNFQKVEQDEYAIEYNTITNKFYNKVLTQGIYLKPLNIEFYKFKRTLQNIEVDGLDCMSRDKVIVKLHVILQIQYYSESLKNIILTQYSDDSNYKDLINSLTYSTILNSCLYWSVEQYYMDRSKIDNMMFNQLVSNINISSIGSQVIFFQLVDIKFPDSYSNLIKEKQNIEQNKQTALNDRINKITQVQTEIIVSKKNAQINLINANMSSNIIVNKANLMKEQISNFWNYRTNYLKQVADELNLNPVELLSYLKQEKISQTQNIFVNI
jgi:hypothetical protein